MSDSGSEYDPIATILEWIGFDDEDERDTIMEESFESFEDLKRMTEKDITDLSKDFAKRSEPDKITFGLRRTKRLKLVLHWVHDFYRCSEDPSIEDIDEDDFLQALSVADERLQVRTSASKKSDQLSREASPGKLDSERKWNTWESGLVNYLSTIPGSFGVPLSYVIRENEDPDPDDQVDFTSKCIACAPLSGPHFEADKREVHQVILSLVQGESAEDWIRDVKRQNNGRVDFQCLSSHFAGEGNATRRIGEAERLRDTLHYKSERAMPFESFLTKAKKMFNIFYTEGEEMAEDAQIRWLLKRIRHPELQGITNALKAQRTTDPTMTFTTVANQIAAEVSELPETVSMRARNVSGANTGQQQGGGRDSIHNEDGSIYTGFYKNWQSLSKEDQDKVLQERERLGIKGGRKKHRGGPAAKAKKKLYNVRKEIKKLKRTISALSPNKEKDNNDGSEEDDTPTQDDAGNQFNGRQSKRQKKSS